MNKQKIPNNMLDKLTFWVFGIITPVNVFSLKEIKKYLDRIIPTLNDIAPFRIKAVPYVLIKNYADFQMYLKIFLDAGYEGVILKKFNAVYKPDNRSEDWLALKLRQTSDLPILRIELGKKGKKNENVCGSVVVKTPKGEAEIGTGYTDDLRKWLYDNRNNIGGLVMEVEHEGFANETGDLVNASCIMLRDDKPRWEMSW